jgi:hypothetical protein
MHHQHPGASVISTRWLWVQIAYFTPMNGTVLPGIMVAGKAPFQHAAWGA